MQNLKIFLADNKQHYDNKHNPDIVSNSLTLPAVAPQAPDDSVGAQSKSDCGYHRLQITAIHLGSEPRDFE